MNDMLQLANTPSAVFHPVYKTFQFSNEYYWNLSREHLVQLVFQQNYPVKSADDYRNKYVARQLFRQLAEQGRIRRRQLVCPSKDQPETLLPAPSHSDSFRFYGDDFRPGNILINDSNEAVSIIDWEFTYTAPI